MKTMNQMHEDDGLLTVLLDRYQHQRLPRVEALQKKVADGDSLNSFDLTFLAEVARSVNEVRPFLERHQECLDLATHMTNLCNDIANKGLANEKRH